MTRGDAVRRTGLSFGLIMAMGAGLATGPVLAADDGGGNMFDSLASFVGMQGDKDKDSIDYRARAPLVVPKDRGLPPPVRAAGTRRADWPSDPDVVARRKEIAERNAPAPQVHLNSSGRISVEELRRGRTDVAETPTAVEETCPAGAGTPSCSYTAWDKLKAKVTGSDDRNLVVGGVEPPREYLTEPPTGYRKPVATTKVQVVHEKEAVDPGDAAGFARANGRHKYSVDE